MTITIETLKGYRMREAAHLNFGGGSYGYDYICSEEPRLSREIRSIKARGRKPGVRSDHYLVDGHKVDTLEHAIEMLNQPPREPPPEVAARMKAFAEMREQLKNKGEG